MAVAIGDRVTCPGLGDATVTARESDNAGTWFRLEWDDGDVSWSMQEDVEEMADKH